MSRRLETSASSMIPDFALYGDKVPPCWHDDFYFERISQRGRSHNWVIRPHRHNALVQILLIETGSGETTVEGMKWKIAPGCLLLIPAQAVHAHRFAPDIDGPVVTAAQRPLESLATVIQPQLVQLLREPVLVQVNADTPESGTLSTLFALLEKESQSGSADRLAAGTSLLLALVINIARLRQTASIRSAPTRDRKAKQIEKFRALVDERLRTHHSVDGYAKSIGVTVSQLGRLSREVIGLSPLEFINARLVREAQRDLAYSSMSVKQVALGLGFSDSAYFTRFFHKQTGVSPTEFRDAAHKALLAPA